MRIESKRGQEAARRVQSYGSEVMDQAGFLDDLTELVIAVQEEEARKYMQGRVEHLGEPYMLYRLLEDSVGQERRPIWRETRIRQIREALDKYLGLKYDPSFPAKRKRKRRRLLTR